MSYPDRLDLEVWQGKTFSEVLRWGSGSFTFKALDQAGAIVSLAPLRIRSTGHGLTDGWPFKLSAIVGTNELNGRDFVCKYVDANIVEVHELIGDGDEAYVYPVNAASFGVYESGGYIEYEVPMDLAGLTMRWQGRLAPDTADPALFDFTNTLNGNGSGVAIDNTAKTITLQIGAVDSAAWTFDSVQHEIEVTSGATKPPFVAGTLTVRREIVK